MAGKPSNRALPPIPRDASPEMRQLLEALKENTQVLGGQGRGNALDRAVTFRDIEGASFQKILSNAVGGVINGGGLTGSSAPNAADTPTTPTNVLISGTDTSVVAGWDQPSFAGYWYTQVYRTTWDGVTRVAFDKSFALTQVVGSMLDVTVQQNTRYQYWFRHVNINGLASPLSNPLGHIVKTTESLDIRKGWITHDKLENDLKGRVDLIDSAEIFGKTGGLLAFAQDVHGSDGAVYTLHTDAPVIKRLDSGYSPASLRCSVRRVPLVGEPSDYSGLFSVELSTDGTNFTPYYTSSAPEPFILTTPLANTKSVRIRAYNTFDVLLDEQIVPVLFDGEKGEQGVTYDIFIESSNGDTFRPNTGFTTVLRARVFKNGVEVTQQLSPAQFRWTRKSSIPLPFPDDDATWDAAHTAGFQSVLVSANDVYGRAVFSCEVSD